MAVKISKGKFGTVGNIPVIFAKGWGIDKEVSREAYRAGKLLQALFPELDFEVRCNSDGLSCGACYGGKLSFNVGVERWLDPNDPAWDTPQWERALARHGAIKYRVYMYSPATVKALSQIPHHDVADLSEIFKNIGDIRSITSPLFDNLYHALAWLLKYGPQYNRTIKNNLTQSPYWVADRWEWWCGETAWSKSLKEFGRLGGRIMWYDGFPQSKSAIPLAFALYAPNGTKIPGRSRLKDIKAAIEYLKEMKQKEGVA